MVSQARSWLVARTGFSLAATLPLGACGLMLLIGSPAWTGALLIGTVLSFTAAVLGTWVLLIEIMR